jgi:Uma2 family endonuclease
MATVTLRRKPSVRRQDELGPRSAGLVLTPEEFDRAEFQEGWRYELIHGVLVVTPPPSIKERDPNEELGYWLRLYRDTHAHGSSLNATASEHTIKTGANRRRADRIIWAGLGRHPREHEVPTIIAEFVSPGKRSWLRDYEQKRDEYMAIKVGEYWVIDRFARTLTVFRLRRGKIRKQVVRENQTYTTDLLPGFELPLAKLLAVADAWAESNVDIE